MEDLLDKLDLEKAQLLQNVVGVEHQDRAYVARRIQSLKDVFEEIELVAAAAAPVVAFDGDAEPGNPNPQVLTAEFYAAYLVVLMLNKDLNDARFLWKRIASETKQSSELLADVWAIGKALWKRDFAATYAAMTKSWPDEIGPIVEALRLSTRESTAELLSVAYSTISIGDVSLALGFADHAAAITYCSSLGWEVEQDGGMVRPKALPRAPSQAVALQQLETLSQYVLHLEQSTLIKLP